MARDFYDEANDIAHLASPLALGPYIRDDFRARPHQKIISDAVRDGFTGKGPRFIAVSVPQQFGKALALDTPVATPTGWTTIGDIEVGDEIFSEDGSITRVVATTPVQFGRPCFAVRFDDGEVIIADEEHEWKANLNRRAPEDFKVYTTRYLAYGKKGTKRKDDGHRSRNPRIPNTRPLQLPWKPLLIPPYVLGLWLGDGTSKGGSVTSHPKDRDELRCLVQGEGYVTYVGKDPQFWTVQGLHRQLRHEGLLNNKHIPDKYLRASETQRWELLQGLIDSDGYVDKANGYTEFTTTNERLSEGVLELVHSLGIKAMLYKGDATLRGCYISPKWRIFFYHPNAARLHRKRVRCVRPLSRRSDRFIRTVEVPSVPVRCIQVDHPSGMFLAGKGMIPTHNSQVTSILAPLWVLELHALGILPGGLVALMSYEDSLAMSWSMNIRRIVENRPELFHSRLMKNSRAASFWETEQGGGVLALGTAGSVQGRSVTLLGLDDITKNFDQAMSPKYQMRIWDNWTSVLYGRLQPWTVVLVTQPRWHPSDFIGRLASKEYEGNPDDWRFIRIPYVCDSPDDELGREIGEPLLRPQADQTLEQAKEEAVRIKSSISTYSWSALWQQSPVDDVGTIFPESRWRYWGGDSGEELPSPDEFEFLLMTWDMAFKDERQHDWVVGQLWGARGADRYLIDQVRGHWGFTETCEHVVEFARRSRSKHPKAQTVLVEDKANGTGIINTLSSKVGGLVPITPEESKLARAWSCQPLLLGGNLYAPAPSLFDWVRDYTKEMADFRGGGSGHDDQVDATTQALRYMMDYQPDEVAFETASDLPIPDRPGSGHVPSDIPAIPERMLGRLSR